MQIEAINVQAGDFIPGFGRVTEVVVTTQDVAQTESARSTKRLPGFINALVRARFAAEAVEQVYKRVPRIVTVHSGVAKRINLQPTDMVTVQRAVSEAA